MQNYHGIVSNGNNATMEASAMEAAAASQLGLDRLLNFGNFSSSGNGQLAVATAAASISDRAGCRLRPRAATTKYVTS